MTPRLAVTREQADLAAYSVRYGWMELDLRLPERPTMPCPQCNGKGWWSRWRVDVGYRSVECSGCARGSVPIPEGTRVEAGWWTYERFASEDHDGLIRVHSVEDWHPVATATLAEVEVEYLMPPDMGECRYLVTLTDIASPLEDR